MQDIDTHTQLSGRSTPYSYPFLACYLSLPYEVYFCFASFIFLALRHILQPLQHFVCINIAEQCSTSALHELSTNGTLPRNGFETTLFLLLPSRLT